jgi:Flp pilus assembly protein protease CpaA
MVFILLIYSGFDLRTRKVPNRMMVIGIFAGLGLGIQSGHLFEHTVLI